MTRTFVRALAPLMGILLALSSSRYALAQGGAADAELVETRSEVPLIWRTSVLRLSSMVLMEVAMSWVSSGKREGGISRSRARSPWLIPSVAPRSSEMFLVNLLEKKEPSIRPRVSATT